jgi:hypothetical protein
MQVRILDHARYLEALKLTTTLSGHATVAIRETEGNVSLLRLELEAGHMRATRGLEAAVDAECTDKTWAAIACGDLKASAAAEWGLIQVVNSQALPMLDALSAGPAPFCNEYF